MWSSAAALAVTVCLLAGCTDSTARQPTEAEGTFALPESDEVTCLEHQVQEPGTAHTGGAEGDTAAIFAMLRYWASHGAKPYCDGEPATPVDLQWRDLVVELGATRPPDPPTGTPAAEQPTPVPPSHTPTPPTTTPHTPTPEST